MRAFTCHTEHTTLLTILADILARTQYCGRRRTLNSFTAILDACVCCRLGIEFAPRIDKPHAIHLSRASRIYGAMDPGRAKMSPRVACEIVVNIVNTWVEWNTYCVVAEPPIPHTHTHYTYIRFILTVPRSMLLSTASYMSVFVRAKKYREAKRKRDQRHGANIYSLFMDCLVVGRFHSHNRKCMQ